MKSTSRTEPTKTVEAARRMTIKVHYGNIKVKSRRRAGCSKTQSNMTAELGISTCKAKCTNIILQNRRRKRKHRVKGQSVAKLEEGLNTIQAEGLEKIPIAKTAIKLIIKTLRKNSAGHSKECTYQGMQYHKIIFV